MGKEERVLLPAEDSLKELYDEEISNDTTLEALTYSEVPVALQSPLNSRDAYKWQVRYV